MDSLEGIAREIREQINAAQRELARVTRKKQQLVAELSRLKKARKVTAV